MSGSPGYTLDQLLEWCRQDRLIDGFQVDEDAILIWHDGIEHALSHADARLYLTQMFTASHRRAGEPPRASTHDARNTA